MGGAEVVVKCVHLFRKSLTVNAAGVVLKWGWNHTSPRSINPSPRQCSHRAITSLWPPSCSP